MDPLSIIGSVAGVAAAGAALSSGLYDLIACIKDAPNEIIETAQGIHDLSTVLRELRRILKKARKILKDRLLKAVTSIMERIRHTHNRVDQLLDIDGNLARVLWAFRRSKAAKLLATIESHKSTIQLITATITLAIVQREHKKYATTVFHLIFTSFEVTDIIIAADRTEMMKDPFFGHRRKPSSE
jgi:hypothetical protein